MALSLDVDYVAAAAAVVYKCLGSSHTEVQANKRRLTCQLLQYWDAAKEMCGIAKQVLVCD